MCLLALELDRDRGCIVGAAAIVVASEGVRKGDVGDARGSDEPLGMAPPERTWRGERVSPGLIDRRLSLREVGAKPVPRVEVEEFDTRFKG